MWRWIEADRRRRHCVVLTCQTGPFAAAVAGGNARDRWMGPRARLAPRVAAGAGRAVARAGGGIRPASAACTSLDSVPAIAFASSGPPIVLLNHAGFSFWIGRDVADVVACLRPSSRDVAVTRRGIAPHRCPPLPIPVNAPDAAVSRSKARELLGLPVNAVVLFTVAMPFKYVPFEPGCSFVDLSQRSLSPISGSRSGDRTGRPWDVAQGA